MLPATSDVAGTTAVMTGTAAGGFTLVATVQDALQSPAFKVLQAAVFLASLQKVVAALSLVVQSNFVSLKKSKLCSMMQLLHAEPHVAGV